MCSYQVVPSMSEQWWHDCKSEEALSLSFAPSISSIPDRGKCVEGADKTLLKKLIYAGNSLLCSAPFVGGSHTLERSWRCSLWNYGSIFILLTSHPASAFSWIIHDPFFFATISHSLKSDLVLCFNSPGNNKDHIKLQGKRVRSAPSSSFSSSFSSSDDDYY